MFKSSRHGFTLVELLIVTIVIGILVAIGIVAYIGNQNRANDVSVRTDLRNMGDLLTLSIVGTDVNTTTTYPNDEAGLSTVGLKVSKSPYGGHLMSGGMAYNALYCSTVTGYSPSNFALIASSKSGNVFSYTNGEVKSFPKASWVGSGWGVICPAILGVAAGNSATGIWLYENSIWKVWMLS